MRGSHPLFAESKPDGPRSAQPGASRMGPMTIVSANVVRTVLVTAAAGVLAVGTAFVSGAAGQSPTHHPAGPTTTPITHLVVIFQENVSFDHYFATYPTAT